MAVNMKMKKKCHIIAPEWLSFGAFLRGMTVSHCFTQVFANFLLLKRTEFLQESLALETSAPSFSKLPFRFAEIAKVILDVYVLQPRRS
jgi:GINS complex subunit 2